MNNFKQIFIILGLVFSMETLANPIFSNELLSKAKSGDAVAQLELADVYIHGYGVDEDDTQAELWATKSAENGNAKAMYWLGNGYATYAGLVEDIDSADADEHYKKAFTWFLKGVDQNHTESMVGLANLYSRGDGINKDPQKALEIRKKAASLGNKEAMKDIAFMYEHGLGVEENKETAKLWEDKASQK